MDLFSPRIVRIPSTWSFQGRIIRGYAYERPFDQNEVYYTLESLLSVVRFGGQGFVKAARSTPIKRSLYPGLVTAAERGEWVQLGVFARN